MGGDFSKLGKIVYRSESVLFVLLLGMLVWLPLPLGSNRPWAECVFQVWVFLITAVWFCLFFFRRVRFPKYIKKFWPIGLLLLLWIAWVLIQSVPLPIDYIETFSPQSYSVQVMVLGGNAANLFVSVSQHDSLMNGMNSIAYVCIFLLIVVLVNNRVRIKKLAAVIILSGVFQAMYGSLMTLSGLEYGFFIKKYAYLGVATGTFVNRNHLAGFLEMCLAVGIGLMIASLDTSDTQNWRHRLRKLIKLFLSPKFRLRLYLVIMVVALVLTHSRMGNTAFFVSLFFTGAIGLVLSKHASKGTVLLLTSLVIIDVFIVGAWFGIDKVVERLDKTSVVVENRDEVYVAAYKQWQDYKMTGAGLGSFYSVFPGYRQQNISGFNNHTHNDYLEFLTETGVIGMGILGLIVGSSLLVALIAQYKRRDPLMRGMSFAGIMGVIAILIHSSVDFNLQIPANAVMFVILLALCWLSLFYRENRMRDPAYKV